MKFKLHKGNLFYIIRKNLDIVLVLSIIFIKMYMYANEISPEYFYAKVMHPILLLF